MPGTATPLEMAWTVVGLAGLALNLWALRDARGDRDALRQAGLNGARRIVADGNVRREWLRVFKLGIFAALGVWAMLVVRSAHLGGAVALGLMAAAVSMVVGSWLDRRERHRLLDYLEQHAPRGGIPDA